MATDNDIRRIPGIAAADLSSNQFYAVRRSADNTFALCNGFTHFPAGILYDKPAAAGEACEVVTGYVMAQLGDTCTAGQRLSVNASGLLIPCPTGWNACARCEVGGVSGDIVSVFFFSGGGADGYVLSP